MGLETDTTRAEIMRVAMGGGRKSGGKDRNRNREGIKIGGKI